jgi:hypothetical protein
MDRGILGFFESWRVRKTHSVGWGNDCSSSQSKDKASLTFVNCQKVAEFNSRHSVCEIEDFTAFLITNS